LLFEEIKGIILMDLIIFLKIIILIIFCSIGFLIGNWSENISKEIKDKNKKERKVKIDG